ncbi:MAG: MFS transporter [Epsilonproteobacteria bacterium]|nr:MAG: MFS transporter [Campylobacterota bacterium]
MVNLLMLKLFKISGFFSYTIIICLNAMTDLGHKIILQNTIFKVYESSQLIVLTSIVNALILMPFIFLFSPAGFLSDKYRKTMVIKYASAFAVFITIFILISYYMGLFWLSFCLTFVLAAQSAIYSPAKYGLIKQLGGDKNISVGNGLVQTVTIVSILVGSVLYSVLFEIIVQNKYTNTADILQAIAPLGYLLVLASVIEYLFALRLIKQTNDKIQIDSLKFDIKRYITLSYFKENFKFIFSNQIVWISIVALGVFWAISQIVVSIFGEYIKTNLYITNTIVAQGLLAISGVGIVVGSIYVSKISRYFIQKGIIPVGAIGIAVCLYLIPMLENIFWLSMAILGFGFFAGLLIVPLNSLIQHHTQTKHLGKVLSGNNFIQNIFMLVFLSISALFGYFKFNSVVLFDFIFIVAVLMSLYFVIKLSRFFVRYFFEFFIALRYDVVSHGLKNNQKTTGTLLLGNHISYLDWAVLQVAYPANIIYVIDKEYYDKWYFKPVLKFFRTIPISQNRSKTALSQVAKALNEGKTVALFPEGSISKTGELQRFKKGYEVALKDTTNAKIVPFYISGLYGDIFSLAPKSRRKISNTKVDIYFGDYLHIDTKAADIRDVVLNMAKETTRVVS